MKKQVGVDKTMLSLNAKTKFIPPFRVWIPLLAVILSGSLASCKAKKKAPPPPPPNEVDIDSQQEAIDEAGYLAIGDRFDVQLNDKASGETIMLNTNVILGKMLGQFTPDQNSQSYHIGMISGPETLQLFPVAGNRFEIAGYLPDLNPHRVEIYIRASDGCEGDCVPIFDETTGRITINQPDFNRDGLAIFTLQANQMDSGDLDDYDFDNGEDLEQQDRFWEQYYQQFKDLFGGGSDQEQPGEEPEGEVPDTNRGWWDTITSPFKRFWDWVTSPFRGDD